MGYDTNDSRRIQSSIFPKLPSQDNSISMLLDEIASLRKEVAEIKEILKPAAKSVIITGQKVQEIYDTVSRNNVRGIR